MSTKSMRILNVAAGVLLIAAGIYCLCNQDVALLSAGLLLGIFLLLSGVAEIVVFAAASGVMLGSGWLLLDGILTVLFNGVIVGSVVHFCYSTAIALPLCMLSVAAGEAVACLVVGPLLISVLRRMPASVLN